MNSGFGELESEFSVIEELSAYLDGELDQVATQKVELRLGTDPEYLAEMQSLQKTWDILDELPLREPHASFTKTTMEIVVNEAINEVRKGRQRNWSWLGRVMIVLATAGLLFGLSFTWIRIRQAEPDRFLIEHLPAIENHERFAAVENDLDFLERLDRFGLFSDRSVLDDDDGPEGDLASSDESYQIPESEGDRRSLVESLDVEQKTKLQRKLDDFIKLPPEQRRQAVDFENLLDAQQNEEQLTIVMRAYYDWLGALDEAERSRLLDLETEQRILSIAVIREKQAREAFGRTGATQLPSAMDAEVVFYWFNELIKAHENRIRAHFARAIVRFARDHHIRTKSMAELRWFAEKGPLNQLVNNLVRVDRDFIEDMAFKDLETLSLLLTIEARAILEDQSLEEQRELVLKWVDFASQSRSEVNQETLRRFARTLSIEEQDQLDKMSTENYFKELKSKYQERQKQSFQKKDDEAAIWNSFFDFENPRNQ